jgi:Fe-S cluster assembly protein SufD
MIPALSMNWHGPDYLRDYKSNAWQAFNHLPIPTTRDEPWRRTDIGGLKVNSFRLSSDVNALDLPPAPEELLQPLIGNKHGGQLLISSDRSRIEIDPEISKKGVVFSDLKTAEVEYPDILAKIWVRLLIQMREIRLTSALAQMVFYLCS